MSSLALGPKRNGPRGSLDCLDVLKFQGFRTAWGVKLLCSLVEAADTSVPFARQQQGKQVLTCIS